MHSFQLGDVTVIRVIEWQGGFAPPQHLVPGSPPELWRDNESWLAPDHWRPETDTCHGTVQTWVLRSEGRTILVDTGVGNDRRRPRNPLFDHLRTDYLDRLADAGVRPSDVDIVVNTHLHADHVGWNTELRDGQWTPTFPHATYLIPRADQVFYDPDNAHRRPAPGDETERLRRESDLLVYADSIAPVLAQAVLWEGGYRIDDNLTLEPAPGHTPGSSVLRLSSGTDRAVFVGDVVHTPVQLLDPSHSSCFCEDPDEATTTRRRILVRAADNRELVIPAHFAGSGVAEVRRDGTRFRITGWPTGTA
ncbi:Glyoxylase, beta-lactamase superfamily II [Streptoalloteichus tenebrarius]|uniref:Glyoxylase, beta-lactamase superfamily II n=1 Tax=Streptoalloteichus tenebrarius (strain ATCC 17920 / DSM 40477 / JCM 4838 / CBS 697.72 / NBRC 16177 / NCIMB 11028 / NRRL B-12390 / A12253. 1 / ISP 5477) TaxID=1933 RepID=A0ABT1HM51_STRSD|nr:MBL fold metallo-hydrolase [Streptoalloteichus tenebrarius]MCP2256573.1 Glyoxylase, beta-lactamase superfamily II [Streptoalloteichus tenebrarius]BFF04925.1 MBL fold metallo-hydrolase [Streptoalloteichus tenebrarius]